MYKEFGIMEQLSPPTLSLLVTFLNMALLRYHRFIIGSSLVPQESLGRG